MSRKQTRRSVSVRPEVYDKLKAYCDARGLAMSALLTELATDGLALAYEREAREERERQAVHERHTRQLSLPGDHPAGDCPCGRCGGN